MKISALPVRRLVAAIVIGLSLLVAGLFVAGIDTGRDARQAGRSLVALAAICAGLLALGKESS